MRDDTSDVSVKVKGIKRRDYENYDGHYVLRVSVSWPDSQLQSPDSETTEEENTLVGEVPVTHAELPGVERQLNAEFVTAHEAEIRAYYPLDDSWVVVLTWDAEADEWNCKRQELESYSFEPEDVRDHDEEVVLWRRVNDESVIP